MVLFLSYQKRTKSRLPINGIAAACATLLVAVVCCSQSVAASSSPSPSSDIHKQFQPAKDDDDGDDYAESQELLYQWIDPRYSQDERTQICGIIGYFTVLGAGLCCVRINAKRKQAEAR